LEPRIIHYVLSTSVEASQSLGEVLLKKSRY
jgi:hypothetical protein